MYGTNNSFNIALQAFCQDNCQNLIKIKSSHRFQSQRNDDDGKLHFYNAEAILSHLFTIF